MVALIDKALDWFNKTMTRIGCRTMGHIPGDTIEAYTRSLLIKNYVTIKGKNFFVPPYKQVIIDGKHRCAACGAVYIGIIVKDEYPQSKPHGTP